MFSFLKPDINKMRNSKDIDGLIKALRHQDIRIRMNAAYAIGDVGDRKGVEPLIEVLKDPIQGWGIRMVAATSLGKLHDERAIEPLEALATGKDTTAADAATIAIARIRGDAPSLIEALGTGRGDIASRVGAIIELGDLGDERAVEPLIGMLKEQYQDEYERGNILFRVITALGDLGDERAIEPIGKYLNDRIDIVSKAAREALEKIEARKSYPPPPPPP